MLPGLDSFIHSLMCVTILRLLFLKNDFTHGSQPYALDIQWTHPLENGLCQKMKMSYERSNFAQEKRNKEKKRNGGDLEFLCLI